MAQSLLEAPGSDRRPSTTSDSAGCGSSIWSPARWGFRHGGLMVPDAAFEATGNRAADAGLHARLGARPILAFRAGRFLVHADDD